ncbi:hypothetical protein [Gracilimonas sp.]|uniref:hypothetical protein n=1 Tax=Gracilimonas sp. TaxID=1974203 RepID=UPI002871A676|nr:hypothetical protein [Gracilimonas sp.]
MKNFQRKYIGVLGSIVLFLSFSVMHSYDWLIPPSPVNVEIATSPIPVSDVVEEHGSKDEIEHQRTEPIYLPILPKLYKKYMISGDFYIPSVSTPPPDVI